MSLSKIKELLGTQADSLLNHQCKTISKDQLHKPGADFVDRLFIPTNRSNNVLRNLQSIYDHGRLSGTGYVSILPVDQGIEHSGGASFAPNPMFFDPENIVKLAIEGGCNAVASTYGVLASVSRKYAHKIPFIVKINHNEFLTYPNKFDQIMFGTIEDAWNMGAAAVGATIYFGSNESARQIVDVAEAFKRAHELAQPLLFVGIGPDDVVAVQRRASPVDPVPVHPPAKVTDADVQVPGKVGQQPFIRRQFDLLDPSRKQLAP